MPSDPATSVALTVSRGVAHVELDRARASNAIDRQLAADLNVALDGVVSHPDVRVVLLSGRGRVFCAGGDVRVMAQADDPAATVHTLATEMHRAIRRLAGLEVPVVAAVHGSVAGAGLGLICTADLVLSGESCRFISAFTGVGLTPDSGTSWHLPRVVGLRRALELTLTNRVLDAREALDWGLISSIHADLDVLPAAQQLAERLANGPASAYGAARQLVRSSLGHDLGDQLEVEAAAISRQIVHPDARRLMNAFVGSSGDS